MTNAEARFNKSHIRKVYACLAVTCHMHFWQNDRDFLRATVVTRGWNGYRNKSQHRKSTLEKKILPPNPRPFNHESGALTTELSVEELSGGRSSGSDHEQHGTATAVASDPATKATTLHWRGRWLRRR